MDYSPEIQFQTSPVNVKEAKELSIINQPENKQQNWCRCGCIKHLRIYSKDFHVGLAIRKTQKMALGVGLSKYEAKKSAEDETSLPREG